MTQGSPKALVGNMNPSEKAGAVVLVDAYSWIFRAFHALPDFRNSAGRPTAVVHGFLSTLAKLSEFAGQASQAPAGLVIFFDRGGPQERLAAYPEYKANRPETPEDLKAQVPCIEEALEAMGLPQVAINGVEADDSIASMALSVAGQGRRVFVASNDKDFFQILSDRISMIRSGGRGEEFILYDVNKLKEKFGLAPDSMIDFYALVGDAVDNVPGVKGIGEKTAARLLGKFPTLDEIYAHLADLAPKDVKLLEKGRESAYLSRDLIRLRTNLEVDVEPVPLDPSRFDRRRLETLLDKMELGRLKSRLFAAPAY